MVAVPQSDNETKSQVLERRRRSSEECNGVGEDVGFVARVADGR